MAAVGSRESSYRGPGEQKGWSSSGRKGWSSYPLAVGQVLPGSTGLRCCRSIAAPCRDSAPPSCRASNGAYSDALVVLPKLRGMTTGEGSPDIVTPKGQAPMVKERLPQALRSEAGPSYTGSTPARPGWGQACPLGFRPTDWFVAPPRARRMLARLRPPRRSADTSCLDPLCGHLEQLHHPISARSSPARWILGAVPVAADTETMTAFGVPPRRRPMRYPLFPRAARPPEND